MPELPEVEQARRLAERITAGRRICRAECAPDEIVLDGTSPRTMSKILKGRMVQAVHRRGKQLWFELDRPPHPLVHFGMAGGFRLPGETATELASSSSRETDEWPPKWLKLHLYFDDGGELVMTDKRRLGRIRLRNDPPNEPPISELGFDPLLDMPSPRRFHELLIKRTAPVKAVLLDQSFAAGVGNWIADEVLYQARVDPRKRARALSSDEVTRLHRALKHIINKAVTVDADKSRFPKSWLFHHRWGKNREARTAKGERIEHITVAGRTTAWVPEVQGR
jgi:formamidopyrimidine-DNA glycosylase